MAAEDVVVGDVVVAVADMEDIVDTEVMDGMDMVVGVDAVIVVVAVVAVVAVAVEFSDLNLPRMTRNKQKSKRKIARSPLKIRKQHQMREKRRKRQLKGVDFGVVLEDVEDSVILVDLEVGELAIGTSVVVEVPSEAGVDIQVTAMAMEAVVAVEAVEVVEALGDVAMGVMVAVEPLVLMLDRGHFLMAAAVNLTWVKRVLLIVLMMRSLQAKKLRHCLFNQLGDLHL